MSCSHVVSIRNELVSGLGYFSKLVGLPYVLCFILNLLISRPYYSCVAWWVLVVSIFKYFFICKVRLVDKYFYNLVNIILVIHVVYFTPLGELTCLLIQKDKYLCRDVDLISLAIIK